MGHDRRVRRPVGRAGDAARLESLHATGLLQASGVPSLDRLTRLARRAVGVPAAVVASLVDADRQVFVSVSGPAGARDSPLSLRSAGPWSTTTRRWR